MFANVIFYLQVTALVWFDNREEEALRGDAFCLKDEEVLECPDDWAQAAKFKVEHRAQLREK